MNWTDTFRSKLLAIEASLKKAPEPDWKEIEGLRKEAQSVLPRRQLPQKIEPGEPVSYMDQKPIAMKAALEDLKDAIREKNQTMVLKLLLEARHDLGF